MPLTIRPATPADLDLVISSFNSTLPFLASVGSQSQWGTTPFSERPDFQTKITDTLAAAETYRTSATGPGVWAYVAESVEGDDVLPVGAVTVKDAWFPEYIAPQPQFEGEVKGARNFLYLHVLVTNFEAGEERRKGAGATLVQKVKELAAELGREVVYVDCWAGNDGKLVA